MTPPTLLAAFLDIVGPWRRVFPQQRTWRRGVRQALGSLVCLGRRCLSRIIWTNGGQDRSWSAEYFLHSRSAWDAQALFQPIWEQALPWCRGRLVGVAVDDTRLRKTGRCIQQAAFHRDPLSPPFHVNLIRAIRFLQASVLVPLHQQAPRYTRAVPVRFEEVSCVKKPGRTAATEAWASYREAVKHHNLSQRFVQMAQALRQALDAAGGSTKTLILAGDGSFANRTCVRARVDRTELIVRTRKDAVLCYGAAPGSRRFYDATSGGPTGRGSRPTSGRSARPEARSSSSIVSWPAATKPPGCGPSGPNASRPSVRCWLSRTDGPFARRPLRGAGESPSDRPVYRPMAVAQGIRTG
jgi:hypothetical protein